MGSDIVNLTWAPYVESLKEELNKLIIQKQTDKAHADYYLKIVSIRTKEIEQKRKEIRENKRKSATKLIKKVKKQKRKGRNHD